MNGWELRQPAEKHRRTFESAGCPDIGFMVFQKMSFDQIAREALGLPPNERALLAASLWESIGNPFLHGAGLDDEAILDLALRRDSEMESGIVSAVSHQDLMERLRRQMAVHSQPAETMIKKISPRESACGAVRGIWKERLDNEKFLKFTREG